MTVELHHGDCLDIMSSIIPRKSIDMILADLPYGTTQCKWDSIIPFESLWEQYKRIIKPRGAIVLFGSQPFTSALIMSNPKWFKYCWVWEKDKAANVLNANKQPLKVCEDIIVFYGKQCGYNPQKEPCKPYRHKNRRVLSNNFGSNAQSYDPDGYTTYTTKHPRNILYCAKAGGGKGSVHSTQKPVALLEYLIYTYTKESETVLDNTMGSGSTGVACINTNRSFIGIELYPLEGPIHKKDNPDYFHMAETRIAQALDSH